MDGVELALLNNRFEGVTRKMANTLLRTGRSGVLNIARDFSCCIVTAQCELLTAHESLPIHVLSGPEIMASWMREYHPDMKPGDAFLNNSPYHGCSHAADHTLLWPVFDDHDVHRFTVVVKAHQADIGNSIPTTYHGSAADVYEEGALIFPCTKVFSAGEVNQDFVRMCRMRIRVPDQWWGDFLAMMGSARTGEQEIRALADEIGWERLEEFRSDWLDYSEKRMMAALEVLPSGKTTRYSTHDHFPGTPEAGVEIKAQVEIVPSDAMVKIDLTDNPDCFPCGLNLSEACSRTAAMVGVFNSIDHTVPKNTGSFRRIDVQLRENCVVGIPQHPTSTSVSTTNIADRVANAVQSALADIADGIGLAECGAVIPPAVGVISGEHPQTGEAFVNQLFLGMSGGAGAPNADSWVTIGHVGNAGLCFVDSIELDELRQPIHVYERRLVKDSEGAGRHIGAPSLRVDFGPLACDISIGYVSDGAVNAAKGVRGGGEGGNADQWRVKRDGEIEKLGSCAQVMLLDGERIVSVSTGGGGYGAPMERDVQQVFSDVKEGWVSLERARDIYKVAINKDFVVDEAQTAALRG